VGEAGSAAAVMSTAAVRAATRSARAAPRSVRFSSTAPSSAPVLAPSPALSAAKGSGNFLPSSFPTSPLSSFVNESESSTGPTYELIAEATRIATARMKRKYDRTASPAAPFNPGDDVFVFAEGRDGDNKQTSFWRGPRRVLSLAPGSDCVYLVEGPPEQGAAPAVVHARHLRPAIVSGLSERERILYNRAPDTHVIDRVVTHRGDSPSTYAFLILWRGWSVLDATWEPLVGIDVAGKPSGVGDNEMVRSYMLEHGLTLPKTTTSDGHIVPRRAASSRTRDRAPTPAPRRSSGRSAAGKP
jgi:hypothetical protein